MTDKCQAGPSTMLRIGLRKEAPFWYEYRTNVKQRWVGRALLEVFVTEFRDRTSEYYQWAIHTGLARVNGQKMAPTYRLKMSDVLQNRVHRHEPPVTAEPIRILYRNDDEGRLVVVKPGSIPVHPTGRYHKLTLLEMLKEQLGLQIIHTSNRLDRLTSGIMVCSTLKETAHKLSEQFAMGLVRKAYVCRVRGRFPAGEIAVDEPMLHCDRQSGISIVHPLGKDSETLFNLLSYDAATDTSVVYCRPITGRTHQIRVHVQFLGHPIVNDPIYAHPIWDKYSPQLLKNMPLQTERWRIEPGSSLNVYGSTELDEVVAQLKTEKDDREDWARWRDENLFGEMLRKEGITPEALPGPNAESPAEQRQRAQATADDDGGTSSGVEEGHYCEECRIPLLPDPKPEELFIYLHAIKYQTDDWTYQDELPWWALANWRTPQTDAEAVKGTVQYGRSADAEMPPEFGLAGRGAVEQAKESVMLPRSTPLITIEEQLPRMSSTDADHPSVVFEVFDGMEDYAAYDIARQIRSATGGMSEAISAERHTGHIIVPKGAMSDVALHLFQEGHIYVARTAYVLIDAPAMPQAIMSALADETRSLALAKGAVNQRRRKGLPEEDPATSLAAPGMDGQRTPVELRLLDAIRDAWMACEPSKQLALDVWRRQHADSASLDLTPKFRVTVDRKGYSMPTMATSDLQAYFGSLVSAWLNEYESEGDGAPWKVDLLEPDVDVTLKLLAGGDGAEISPFWSTKKCNVPGRFVFLIALPKHVPSFTRPSDIPNHLVHGGTALARYRAYMLAVSLPVARRDKDTAEPLRIWEPCVGSGGVAVELAAALRRRRMPFALYASDLLQPEVDKAREMLAICGEERENVKLKTVDATDSEAAAAFVGTASNGLDGIVTDLPWGRRVLSHSSIAKLYPAMLRVFIPLLKPGAAILLMTAETKSLTRAVKAYEAEARKRAWGWYVTIESVDLEGLPVEHVGGPNYEPTVGEDAQSGEERAAANIRNVKCGYDVGIVCLRKRPLLS